MGYGRHSTVKQILDNEKARAVLLKHAPKADKHPDLADALFMTIDEAASYPEANISRAQLEAIVKELGQIEDQP